MRIEVRVKPGAKAERVEETSRTAYTVRVKARPVEGKANEAVVRALAAHFGVAKSRVMLVRGATGRNKVFEIS